MTLMQIGTIIFTTTGLLALGMITGVFIKQMENLETEVGDELARGRKCLEKFRRLKKGLSPYLFAEFSFNTFAMVVLLFMVVGVFKSKLIWPNLLILGLNTMFSGVQMLYIGVMAEETKSKFGNILPFLRLNCLTIVHSFESVRNILIFELKIKLPLLFLNVERLNR